MSNSRAAESAHIAATYLRTFEDILRRIDVDAITRATDCLRRARDRGAIVYIAGNGGSSAIASHFANDLGKAAKHSRRAPIRVLSLSDNTPWFSALANDEGYDRVFCGQLENFARAGDVLIVISSSGNSRNLVQAVELARDRGVHTVGLLGFDGGKLKERVDECVWVPTAIGAYGPAEDSHALICHIMTQCLVEDREQSVHEER